jgi:hypothetical protein
MLFSKWDEKKSVPLEEQELQYMKWDGTKHYGQETRDTKIIYLTNEWVDWVWPADDPEMTNLCDK